jgi:hypothetical protein
MHALHGLYLTFLVVCAAVTLAATSTVFNPAVQATWWGTRTVVGARVQGTSVHHHHSAHGAHGAHGVPVTTAAHQPRARQMTNDRP